MKKIYVIQMHTNTIPSKFVKLMTRYKYSHIALSLDKKCDNLYSFGRKKYNSIIDSGFVCENKNGMFFKKFKNTVCKIYEIKVTNSQYNKLKNLIEFMEENSEVYKYDYLGACLRYFKIPAHFKNKYVCSTFVAELLNKADICEFNKKTYFIEPKDFAKQDDFNLIYTGLFKLYD